MFFYSIAASSTSRRTRQSKRFKVQALSETLQKIDGMVDQNRAEDALRFGQDILQRLLDVLLGIGQRHDAHGRALPHVVKIQFRNRNVEFAAQPILQASQNLALIFEGSRLRDVQFQRQQTDGHGETKRRRAAALQKTKSLFAGGGAGLGGCFGSSDLGYAEGFQNVANLDVVEVGDAYAAFKAGANFAGVVFEALERAELGGVDNGAVAQHAHLGVA